MARSCLIFLTVCAGASGCDSGEGRSDSEQTAPNSEQPKTPSVERGPQDALLLAQRAHGLFLDAVGPDAFAWYEGTARSNANAFSYTKPNSLWVWAASSVSGNRYVYVRLIPAWSSNELVRWRDVGLDRIGPFRWRSHRIALFGDPNDAFFTKVQKDLLRLTQMAHPESSREDQQPEQGTDTLLLAQRISHQFAMAIPDGIPLSGREEDFLQVSLMNYGFAPRPEAKHYLTASGYLPRIAPEGDKPVWLWRVWDQNDGKKFLLIEVLPEGRRVPHAGVMQAIKDYGPHTVQEHTWEGHGIRLYGREGRRWVDEVMAAFTDHFSPVQAEEEEPQGGW
jgi:hypothetical protein